MVVHKSGRNCVALYINSEEFASYGWLDIDEFHARILAEDALTALGMEQCGFKEIEAFSGDNGIMIFASIETKIETLFFVFKDGECLLNAVRSINPGNVMFSSLYRYESNYLLCVSGSGKPFETETYRLSEFGDGYSYPPEYRLFLAEHGVTLAEANAVEKLCG